MTYDREIASHTALNTTNENDATVVLLTTPHRNYQWRFLTMFLQGMTRLSKLDRPSVYYRVLFGVIVRFVR